MSAILNAQLFLDHYDGYVFVKVKDVEKFPVEIVYALDSPKYIVTPAAKRVADIHLNILTGIFLSFFLVLMKLTDAAGCFSAQLIRLKQFFNSELGG